jgi:hypothetical protein
VRLLLLALVLTLPLVFPAAAQDKAPAPKKKPAAKKAQQAAHKKPTPEQIRKFNQLEKKQAPEPAKK